jgi:hypothetical protein
MTSVVVATSFQRMRPPQRSRVCKFAANTCRSYQAQGFSRRLARFSVSARAGFESAHACCAREQLELRGGAGGWVVRDSRARGGALEGHAAPLRPAIRATSGHIAGPRDSSREKRSDGAGQGTVARQLVARAYDLGRTSQSNTRPT